MAQVPVPNPQNPFVPPVGTGPLYFNSGFRIITAAMQDCKLLGKGDIPDSQDYADYLPRLNELINLWQTQGLKLWLQEDLAITPIAGTNLYSWGPTGTVTTPKPPRFLEAYYVDNANNRRPLIVLSRNEWDYLSTTVTQGSINSYFTDKQQELTNLYLWLTPDAQAATGTVHMLTQIPVNNIISITDQMNFPREWYIALHWGLADEISSGQPNSVIARCQAKAQEYRTMLEDWDVEDASTSFQPDPRSQNFGVSQFR